MTHPLKRVGDRGEGKFEEVSWDEALTDIADGILDAIEDQGPESVITPFTPEPAAAPAAVPRFARRRREGPWPADPVASGAVPEPLGEAGAVSESDNEPPPASSQSRRRTGGESAD